MSINACSKGKRGERAWRDILRQEGFEARRGKQFSGDAGSPDVIHNVPWVHFEVKWDEHLNIFKAIEQAHRDAPQERARVVAHKKNGKPWLCTMTAEDFFKLIK